MAVQGTLDELGTPLSEVCFVVVDLETTGGSSETSAITEIGAVKVRGGEVLGEFQTLVNPDEPIPPFIALLTGITDAMVASAPRIGSALSAFLEFARGTVLVAHNARFDIGFLKAACARTGIAWPEHQVLDTVRLAQHTVGRDEVPNLKLASLATLFRSTTTPNHRALADARATVDVLHGVLARVGNLGVTSLEELATFTSRVSPAQRRKRYLAESLPSAPGVYVFTDQRGHVLYVGTSKDIRTRVRSYFTASETRSRMAEMVSVADAVTPVVCLTRLEAEVRELRLIAEHKPRYNRRSRHPERAPWLKLTAERFPRLSVVRQVRDDVQDGAAYVGPFSSAEAAERAMAAVHEAFPLRQCTRRFSGRPAPSASACILADMGRCGAPCTGAQSEQEYAEVAGSVRRAFTADARAVVSAVLARARLLSGRERYEDAALHRDRLLAFLHAAGRAQRLDPLARCAELLAARRAEGGGWEVVLVRHGRLAGTTTTPRGGDPMPFVEALRSTGEVVAAPVAPAPAASPEETEKVLRWLESPGVRLIEMDGDWSCPVHGAAGLREQVGRLQSPRTQEDAP
ncbi:MAG: DEDD exonuclease domain-containing protein [Actinomycetes bacterium]